MKLHLYHVLEGVTAMKTKLITRLSKYLLIVSMVFVLLWIVLQGYSVTWTGFGDFIKPNGEFVRGKSLWDWMQLLILPLVGSVGVYLLNRSERKTERERAEEQAKLERQRASERAKLEQEIASDHQHESALHSYLDRMSNLLLEKNLRTSESEEVMNVARVWTLTVLRGLDKTRKGIVVRFVREAGLIYKAKPVVRLSGADLRGAILSYASLSDIYLGVVDLRDAELISTDLKDTDLSAAKLQGANLQGAFLGDANLNIAELQGAKLQGAYLSGANLVNANLQDADLRGAALRGTKLKFAVLDGADLSRADLNGANVTNEQLSTVKSLEGAILPDGTIHE